MNRLFLILILLIALSCENKKEYLIQVPEKAKITSESILSILEEKAKEEPENEWLLNQQLYFCEQLGWPDRCERTLRKAKEKFGLTERLIDRIVAFHLQKGNYKEVAQILQGAIETRSRLEALIQVGIHQDSLNLTYLNRYLERNQDARAFLTASKTYLQIKDSVNAKSNIKSLLALDPQNVFLKELYPVLIETKEYLSALQIIENQLAINPSDIHLSYDQANVYHYLGETDTAMYLLKNVKSSDAYLTLHNWYKEINNYDSALAYLKKVDDYSNDAKLLLSHAELLEAKGFLTLSLPYFESSLAIDSTNLELQNRVDIVRRKVAYLRKKREEQALPTPPVVERKTIGN